MYVFNIFNDVFSFIFLTHKLDFFFQGFHRPVFIQGNISEVMQACT